MGINIRNSREYIENFLKIRTKDMRVVPLRFNFAQEVFYEAVKAQYKAGKPIRMIVLKARQHGISTVTEAMIFHRTATKENVSSQIVAHREDSTANLFRMFKLFYENLPTPLQPMKTASNAQELVFDNPEKDPVKKALRPGLNSRVRCNTAGGDGIGRSDTLQNVHASEFAFWRGNIMETWTGLIQAVPALPGTMVVIESTPNGFNAFKDIWDDAVAGRNDFYPLFLPWYINPEYAMPVPEGTTFTPEELEMRERYSLADEQLQWRRWCIRNNCAGDERKFREEYPSNPDEAFLLSGEGWFVNELVMKLKEQAPKPRRTGEFEYDYDGLNLTNIRWVDNPAGCIRIYEEPQKKRPYVLGGDTAGEGSDWFGAFVVDNITKMQMAVLHKQYDEAAYARQVYCLGWFYNWALVGVEINFSTFPTMELARLRYPKMYVRERTDTYTGKLKESYGFRTDGVTRPVILAGLREMLRQHPEVFVDEALLGEMLTFVKDENGRPAALSGKFDDLVMSAAITYGICGQQSALEHPEGFSMEGWRQDMIEDYERADEAERAYLRQAWGKKEDA